MITALRQDRRGLIWIGSRNGLYLFDGYGYTPFQYDASDPGSLSDSTIRTVYEEPDGTLWLGTNAGGLDRFDPATRTFIHHRHDGADPRTLSHESVYAVLRDRRGRLWVGTQKGLNRLDPGAPGFVRILRGGPEGLTDDYIMAVYEDRNGTLWVGTLGGGLLRWDDAAARFYAFRHEERDPTSLVDDSVTSILEDDAGSLWVGTLAGLSRLAPDRNTFSSYRGLPAPVVTCLALGPDGRLWIGTHGGGLVRMDTATGAFDSFRHDPSRPGGLTADRIIALLVDRGGSLWVGTWGGGLVRVSRASQWYGGPGDAGFPPAGVPDGDVTALLEDRAGGTWIGTRTGYLVRRDPATGRYATWLRGGAEGVSRTLIGLEEDRRGRIWLGTSQGLIRLDPGTGAKREWTHDARDPNGIGPGYVSTILEDRDGRLWIGTGEGGVNEIDDDGRVLRRFVHDPEDTSSLSDDYVTVIFEDSRARFWIGTRSGGLDELDRSTGRALRYEPVKDDPTSLPHQHVTSLVETAAGDVWVGTIGGGLSRVDREPDGRVRFERVTERDGLVDDDVVGLLTDEDDSLWVATRHGLSRYDPRRRSFSNLFVSDGLPSTEFEPDAVARGDGRLCFGTVSGLVVVPAGTAFEPPLPSPVVVRSIRTATGEVLDLTSATAPEGLKLPYGAWLAVEAAVLDYLPEGDHRYAYRLAREWVEIGGGREINFSALQPGAQTVFIRGRNGQGVWNETETALRVTVVPPFWMTLWFRLSLVGALVALAFGAHRRRTSVLEKRNRKLVELHRQLDDAFQRLRRLTRRLEAAKEDERRRIARELHDEMGPSLTAVIIELQLLPARSSPEALQNKIPELVRLVDRMVERIREISLDLRPPLIDELGLVPALSGYLENVSERSGLDIRLRSDPTLGKLPEHVPMTAFRVVQEAITNVVRHAAASHADVTVRRDGEKLVLSVEDDGKGFEVRDAMDRASSGRALGLLGMQERVGMVAGEIEIVSTPGKGTSIRARLPLTEPS